MPALTCPVHLPSLALPPLPLQEHAPAMVVLQPALEAVGLGGRAHIVVEWARGVREAVKVSVLQKPGFSCQNGPNHLIALNKGKLWSLGP